MGDVKDLFGNKCSVELVAETAKDVGRKGMREKKEQIKTKDHSLFRVSSILAWRKR